MTPAHLAQELKHLLSRLVARQAEIVVKRAVVLAGSAMSSNRHALCPEHSGKSLRLRLGLRVIGAHNVEDQERRNVLAPGNVRDRGQLLLQALGAEALPVRRRYFFPALAFMCIGKSWESPSIGTQPLRLASDSPSAFR